MTGIWLIIASIVNWKPNELFVYDVYYIVLFFKIYQSNHYKNKIITNITKENFI